MKVYIYRDEDYLLMVDDTPFDNNTVEVSDEFLKRYKALREECISMQEELTKLKNIQDNIA